ncbi:MAG: B12-binding domain-containing radical SAM protein [Treponemataceae bacterium]|nr:B12-binding domain-containing radical SAM protein [Treponemataceae bacterium]
MNNHSVTLCTILVEKSPQALPLGVACVASSIKNLSIEFPDLKVNLVDFNLEQKLSVEKITNDLLCYDSAIYCFSIFVWNKNLLLEVASELKKKNSTIICIAGGPEVTANPKNFLSFDYVISGEGEKVSFELIKNIFNGTQINEKILFGKRESLESLTSPYLDKTLNPKKYDGALWELARGCPFKCSYCYESKGDKKVEYFSFERIKEELDLFVKNDIKQIFVLDPTYNVDKSRAIKLLDYIRQKAKQIFFHFECRAEFISDELAKAFSKINCSLQIGLQSASEEVLKTVNRTFNKKDFIKKISILNNYGIIFGFDLIYGLPKDNYEGFKSSIDFAISLYPNHIELFCLSVLPGTALFDDANKLNLSYELQPPYHVIESDTFSKVEIEKARKISIACNLFYSQGRAVPWFNSLMHLLKMKPSNFFEKFVLFLEDKKLLDKEICNHKQIEKLQIEFVNNILKQKSFEKYYLLIKNLIELNGALSRSYSDGENTELSLSYHPDDLMSEYSQDLKFFLSNAQKFSCKVLVKNNSIKFVNKSNNC